MAFSAIMALALAAALWVGGGAYASDEEMERDRKNDCLTNWYKSSARHAFCRLNQLEMTITEHESHFSCNVEVDCLSDSRVWLTNTFSGAPSEFAQLSSCDGRLQKGAC